MGLAVAAQLVAAPLSQTMTVAGRQAGQLLVDLGRLTLIGGCGLAAVVMGWGPHLTVLSLSCVSAAGYALMWSQNHRAARALDERRQSQTWPDAEPRER
jgi:hypothetical protein